MSRDEESQIKARLKEEITKRLLADIDDKVEAAYKNYLAAEEDRIANAVKGAIGKSRRKGKGGRGPTITLDDKTCDKVLAAIKKHPDLKSGQIKEKLPDIDDKVIAKAITLLRDQKKVKMRGVKAGATYTAA